MTLKMHSQTVVVSLLVQDYHYRQAQTDMQTLAHAHPKFSV
ncbi:hypothetical protein [Utexia brackfieldae]